VGSLDKVSLEAFANVLKLDGEIFHFTRTPEKLLQQWQLLYKYNLIKGQEVN
jgi:hypothetical protein